MQPRDLRLRLVKIQRDCAALHGAHGSSGGECGGDDGGDARQADGLTRRAGAKRGCVRDSVGRDCLKARVGLGRECERREGEGEESGCESGRRARAPGWSLAKPHVPHLQQLQPAVKVREVDRQRGLAQRRDRLRVLHVQGLDREQREHLVSRGCTQGASSYVYPYVW